QSPLWPTHVHGVGAPPPTPFPELTPSPRRVCDADGLGESQTAAQACGPNGLMLHLPAGRDNAGRNASLPPARLRTDALRRTPSHARGSHRPARTEGRDARLRLRYPEAERVARALRGRRRFKEKAWGWGPTPVDKSRQSTAESQ